jgi:phosphoglycolate phosphatase-like HAD superfamily hydrolase
VLAEQPPGNPPEASQLPNIDPRIARAFVVNDPLVFEAKRTAIFEALNEPRGAEELPPTVQVRVDWDGSMTRAHTPSSFRAAHEALEPPEIKLQSAQDRRKCLALQRAGALPLKDLVDWTGREAGRYVAAETPDARLEKASRNIILRPGARRLAKTFRKRGVELIVATAGNTNVIRHASTRYNLGVAAVIGNELFIGNKAGAENKTAQPHRKSRREKDVVIGRDKNVVHTLNKHERIEARFPRQSGQRRIIIVYGDHIHDALMARKDPLDTIVRVRVAQDGGNTEEYLQESFAPIVIENDNNQTEVHPSFDLVLRDTSLAGLETLVDVLLTPPPEHAPQKRRPNLGRLFGSLLRVAT